MNVIARPSISAYARSPLRAAAIAGLVAAAILVVNAAKRAGVLPSTAATQLLAPLAEILAIGLVTGLFVVCAPSLGRLGRIAFGVQFVALGLLVGVEFVINLVFAAVAPATVADLRDGPLGAALTVSSILFLVGSVGFAAALACTGLPPRGALLLYAGGAVPVALRAFVPEAVLDAGLVTLAAGAAWLAVWLLRTASYRPRP